MDKHLLRILASGFVFLALSPVTVAAQQLVAVQPEATYATAPSQTFSPVQLDQLLAPVALYPDPLIATILEASTYPLDIVQAYRWLQSDGHSALQGNDLAAALEPQDWNPSVKELVASPQVLRALNDNLEWTEQIGKAYMAQLDDVADSVQRLRRRAEAAGTLTTTPQQTVSTEDDSIVIQPTNPEIMYVPYYNPNMVYGSWPYNDYPPYYFAGYDYPRPFIVFSSGFSIIRFVHHHHRHRRFTDHHDKKHHDWRRNDRSPTTAVNTTTAPAAPAATTSSQAPLASAPVLQQRGRLDRNGESRRQRDRIDSRLRNTNRKEATRPVETQRRTLASQPRLATPDTVVRRDRVQRTERFRDAARVVVPRQIERDTSRSSRVTLQAAPQRREGMARRTAPLQVQQRVRPPTPVAAPRQEMRQQVRPQARQEISRRSVSGRSRGDNDRDNDGRRGGHGGRR